MADIGDILASTLTAATKTVDDSERAALLAQVEAVENVQAGKATLKDLLSAQDAGWLPDYYAGDQITVNAQFIATEAKETTLSGTGSVGGTVGPVTIGIQGSLAQTTRQGTQTNLAVSVTLVRQSRSKAVDNAYAALGVQATPALPTGAPTTSPALNPTK